jgi:hypothetical protein
LLLATLLTSGAATLTYFLAPFLPPLEHGRCLLPRLVACWRQSSSARRPRTTQRLDCRAALCRRQLPERLDHIVVKNADSRLIGFTQARESRAHTLNIIRLGRGRVERLAPRL